jgi:hypothetical protein
MENMMKRLSLYLLGLFFCLLRETLWALPALARPISYVIGWIPERGWQWLCRKDLEAQLTFHY